MTYKIYYLLLLFAITTWSACGCPPDEQTGELSLGADALAFLPYDGNVMLTFVNENGETMKLSTPNGLERGEDNLCYRTTCTEAKFGSPSSCEFYVADNERAVLFNADNSVALDLLVFSDVYEYGMPEFYDAFQMSFSSGTPSIVAQYVIEPRITGTFGPTKINFSDPFEEVATLTLNGQNFTDVLVYEEGNLGIYMQPNQGVIGLKDADHTWVIQE